MSKSIQTVFVARGGNNGRCYHSTDDCFNLPDNHREVAIEKVTPTYDPCGRCTDSDGESRPTKGRFVCTACDATNKVASTAVRTLAPCPECESVTTHERD